jgi:multicomponent Na+:H+ antiporter subunit F
VTIADLALLLVAVGMLAAVYRAFRGPTAADRLVAAELGFIATVCAVVLVEMRVDLPALLDIALAAVLVGFLATVGLSRLVPVSRAQLRLDDDRTDDDRTGDGPEADVADSAREGES